MVAAGDGLEMKFVIPSSVFTLARTLFKRFSFDKVARQMRESISALKLHSFTLSPPFFPDEEFVSRNVYFNQQSKNLANSGVDISALRNTENNYEVLVFLRQRNVSDATRRTI